jgi:hypothetical protein
MTAWPSSSSQPILKAAKAEAAPGFPARRAWSHLSSGISIASNRSSGADRNNAAASSGAVPCDKALAIAAYRKASTSFRPLFEEAVSRFHGEALALLTEISAELNDPDKNSGEMNKTCANAARRLRVLIDEANTIVNGESPRRGVGALFGIR